MRVFAAVLLSVGLTVSPVFAANNDAKDTANNDSTVAASNETVPAAPAKAAAKTDDSSAIENQLLDLRNLVESQTQELDQQRAMLKAEQLKMEALEEKLHAKEAAEPATTPAVGTIPTETIGISPAASGVNPSSAAQGEEEKPSPLYFKIGAAQFYPLGFMDAMSVFRTTQLGTLGTSFGSLAFNNTLAGRLTEDRFSIQNSRIGLRTQAKFGQADVTGYLEADFLGYQPANANVTSNSNTLRMRLYWVDYRRGKLELLAGQSWSMLTPNRNGIGALPGDLFYSQDVDTNYQLGLTWTRNAGIRFLYHPSNKLVFGLALENPEQTLPSSVCVPLAAGGCSTTQPQIAATNPYSSSWASQFDLNSGNTSNSVNVNSPNTPNLHPDIILKGAYDDMLGSHHVHFDVAGLFRTFRAVNVFATPSSGLTPANTITSMSHGGGVEGSMNIELVKNFRFITTAFFGKGVGRYIGNTAGPDVIIRADGTLESVKGGSGISGFEWTPTPKLVLYGYYSGAYFGKAYTGTSPATFAGYGFPGSSNSNDRYLYEPTIGIHYMFWRNPNYGDLRIMTQYSYVSRTPWAIGSGPATAHNSMVYVDLRYDLP